MSVRVNSFYSCCFTERNFTIRKTSPPFIFIDKKYLKVTITQLHLKNKYIFLLQNIWFSKKVVEQNIFLLRLIICGEFKTFENIIKKLYIRMKGGKQEHLFHIFIQNADAMPKQSSLFPHFQYMQKSIKRAFNQVKKSSKSDKSLDEFKVFWNELSIDDKVGLYCKWGDLLKKAVALEKVGNFKPDKQSITMQDQIYVKKSFFNKWEKRIVKLTSTHFHLVTHAKTKQYPLRNYGLRKSKNKEILGWVLMPVVNDGRVLHCGVTNKSLFDEWYYALSCNIQNERIFYFLKRLHEENAKKPIIHIKQLQRQQKVQEEKKEELEVSKTLTEIMIDNQMKSIDNDDFNENGEVSEKIPEKIQQQQQEEVSSIMEEKHPNIFKRLIPQHGCLLNFVDTPVNCPLVHCDADYRIYEIPSSDKQSQTLKFFAVLPYPKKIVFEALTIEGLSWNEDADVVNIKTKISSQNSALIYEKNKSQGILYRERDFLYLRHCFSIKQFKTKNTFIVDKSIDSIHQPPFMTVVRAEKQLIWGLIEKESDKQCMLIVEGWIKGGGYMSPQQNKDMTLKFMKKFTSLSGFLKQLSFGNNSNKLFEQNWETSISDEITPKESRVSEKNQKSENSKDSEEEKELEEFIKKVDEQIIQSNENLSEKSEKHITQHESYVPPSFDNKRFVIIPQQYLKKKHILHPKEKSKNPVWYPHFRGHHLWKGQWEILTGGGLTYIDQEKMKEQKKVLTYIIKRIGKNILSGKGILNVSLPVDIFCVQSNVQRLAMSFGYFPNFLEKAATISEPQLQLKYVVASGMASSLIYMTMQKPFNPILGETYQCWIDGCPIYFEQISHHPPIAAFYMVGRGYKVSGNVEAKMDVSINSGKGNNEGIFCIEFDNGNKFYFTTPVGMLSGLTYGERKLVLYGKSFYWMMEGLFLQITYDPGAKNRGFFGSSKNEGEQKLYDYFEGHVKRFRKEDVYNTVMKKTQKQDMMIMPKSEPSTDPLETIFKIHGRWNNYIYYNGEKVFDVNEDRYYPVSDEQYPLASHSNYRQDIVYRRLRDFISSQEFKEKLQIKQREDRRLRAQWQKQGRK